MLVGAVLGVAVALGHLPYLAGSARVLADTALRIVGSAGTRLIHGVAHRGAPRRVVLGLTSLLSVLAPGVTALVLVLAARGTLRLRAAAAVLLAVLGVASFVYHPAGVATGTVALALAVAGLAVALTGPLVAGPLAGLAGLIGGSYLPRLVEHGSRTERAAVETMHRAVYARPGDPTALRAALIVVAAAPFALAIRYVLRR